MYIYTYQQICIFVILLQLVYDHIPKPRPFFVFWYLKLIYIVYTMSRYLPDSQSWLKIAPLLPIFYIV